MNATTLPPAPPAGPPPIGASRPGPAPGASRAAEGPGFGRWLEEARAGSPSGGHAQAAENAVARQAPSGQANEANGERRASVPPADADDAVARRGSGQSAATDGQPVVEDDTGDEDRQAAPARAAGKASGAGKSSGRPTGLPANQRGTVEAAAPASTDAAAEGVDASHASAPTMAGADTDAAAAATGRPIVSGRDASAGAENDMTGIGAAAAGTPVQPQPVSTPRLAQDATAESVTAAGQDGEGPRREAHELASQAATSATASGFDARTGQNAAASRGAAGMEPPPSTDAPAAANDSRANGLTAMATAAPGAGVAAAPPTGGSAATPPPDPGAAARAGHADMLSTPLHSPAFAPALAARVVVMLREGTREARLQLNPAELGPIGVRISVDGSLARVELVADQAPTRAVLEQALPNLAGALRDSGLTLAGGGVFDAPRDGRQGSPGAPGTRSGLPSGAADDATAQPVATPPRAAARGMVDLYA